MPFRLWILCFDDLTYKILQKLSLPQVHPISIADFEHGDEELLRAKGNRSRVEYYFTCTPSLPLYVLRNHPEVDVITYVDVDLFFFSSPSSINKELGDSSVLIVGHRFPRHRTHLGVYGIYNVGFLSFRRDDTALQCLQWWRERCLEWCYDRVEPRRFGDQKYLDDWPTRFNRVVVLQHKGGGLAPWNVANYCLRLDKGQVVVNSDPLIFFHFSGLKQLRAWLYDPGLELGVELNSLAKRHVYGPYIRELREVSNWLSLIVDQSYLKMGSIRGGVQVSMKNYICQMMTKTWKMMAKNPLLVIKILLRGPLLVVIGDAVV